MRHVFRQPAPVDFLIKTGCHIGGDPRFQVTCDAFDSARVDVDWGRLSVSICTDAIGRGNVMIAFGKQGVLYE